MIETFKARATLFADGTFNVDREPDELQSPAVVMRVPELGRIGHPRRVDLEITIKPVKSPGEALFELWRGAVLGHGTGLRVVRWDESTIEARAAWEATAKAVGFKS